MSKDTSSNLDLYLYTSYTSCHSLFRMAYLVEDHVREHVGEDV